MDATMDVTMDAASRTPPGSARDAAPLPAAYPGRPAPAAEPAAGHARAAGVGSGGPVTVVRSDAVAADLPAAGASGCEVPPRSGTSHPPRAALLMLADGRFPAGGHAHSGGVEAAVKAGRIGGPGSLEAFCRGRLRTSGLVAAALAAAAAAGLDPLALDEAADARTPSPALRTTARKLGRQLMRAARTAWPSAALDDLASARPRGAHQPVVLGLAVRAAGLGPLDAAHTAAYESVTGPATAAVRLLSLDPFAIAAVLARLAPDLDDVAARAAQAAHRALTEGTDALPAASAPLLDVYAQAHAAWPVRLFAS